MFNQIFNKKVVVPFFQLLGIVAIFQWIIFPGLTSADTLVNIFSLIIGFFTLLALYYIVINWCKECKPNQLTDDEIKSKLESELGPVIDNMAKEVKKRKPKSKVTIDFTDAKGMNEIAGVINPIAEGRVKVSVENIKVKPKTNTK